MIIFITLFSINSYIAFKEYNFESFMDKYIFLMISAIFAIFILFKTNFIVNTVFASITPLLLINSVIDIKTLTLSKKISVLIYTQGLISILLALILKDIKVSYLYSCVLNSILLYIIYLIIALCSNGKFGGGDVKLISAIGIYFTLGSLSEILIYPLLIGVVVGILLMFFKKYKVYDFFPFGPCIVIASYILYLKK